MDIDLLSKMVREIILESDEVTLPGVGMFVAETVPASFSNKGFTINPPYRRLSFRQKQGSDTLLADYYAATYSVPRERAGEVLEAFLAGMKDVLKEKKVIVFPELGRLRATKENQFFFVSDEAMDISPMSFGLEAVSLKSHGAVEAPVVPAVPDPVAEEETVVKEEERDARSEPGMTKEAAKQEATVAKEEVAAKTGKWWKVVVWIVVAVAVLLAVWAILGRVAPDFVDRFLYSEEELAILRYEL